MNRATRLTLLIVAALPAERPAHAQEPDSFVVVTPGPQYARGGLHRVLSGGHYRDLWNTPIRVRVLDLGRFGGGLRPLLAHSGSQTKSIRFAGGDGREYQFRSVDKDPTAALAPELQGSAYAKALRDGVSASFPAAPLVASALLDVAGVLQVRQTLAVLPDDPRLGEFRTEFKNVLGMIEERPGEYSEEIGPRGGPRRIISPTRAFALFDASPDDRVDARAFLKARLMDVFMGDRDRHRDQFRWAAFGEQKPIFWQPISRDHDEAFVQLDGLALDISRLYYQPLVEFQPEYPKHDALNWHAREVDRRFLVGLGRETWDSVAKDLQARLTDAAIEGAVRHMPPEMYPVGGERLTRVLRARRDRLVERALSYYAFLAGEVEIHATNVAETAEVDRVDDHTVRVRIRARGDAQPYFDRRFDDRETHEVRLAMWGGDDSVAFRGTSSPDITIRVIGGNGDDLFVDSTATGGIKLYDHAGTDVAVGSRKPSVNRKPHPEWVGSDQDRYPPREWGTWWRPLPWLEANSDLGLFVGAGFLRTGYGFRRSPYSSNIRARFGYATGANAIRADLDGEFHPENASRFLRLHLLASGIEVLRYYGQGNQSPRTEAGEFYRLHQQVYAAEPTLVFPVGRLVKLSAGVSARWSHTGDNDGRFIATIRDTVLGTGDFGQVGARVAFELDSRDRLINPLRGIRLYLAGSYAPAVWDVPSAFGSGEAEATTFLSAKVAGTPTLALRAGGRKVWGRFPFHESAFIGGRATLPGFHSNRFAGDASLYGNLQLRLTAGRSQIALPGVWGIFGSAGAGRVYLDGASPGGWHTGVGGGIWFAFLDRSNTASLGIISTKEGSLLQFGVGFGY
jgi:hypothetical protein